MTDRDFSIALAYEVLGLKPGATQTDARAARLQLVRSFHPDIYEGDRAAADRKLARINAAFDDVLQDLRDRGSVARVAEPPAEPVTRPVRVKRKVKEPRRDAAPAPRQDKATKTTVARALPLRMVRNDIATAGLSEPHRRAHRAAEAAFTTARAVFRGDGRPTVRLTA